MRLVMCSVASVCVSPVRTLTLESSDLQKLHFWYAGTMVHLQNIEMRFVYQSHQVYGQGHWSKEGMCENK